MDIVNKLLKITKNHQGGLQTAVDDFSVCDQIIGM
jgi:hypothetical protein